ncbi:MAG: hypothetical protein KDD50_09865 [Bdellovibrionales bacterium]|nr:hypothetical protein [Bdellovibrionales bacterium]
MKLKVILLFYFFISLVLASYLSDLQKQRSFFDGICLLVKQNFYQQDEHLKSWYRDCKNLSQDTGFIFDTRDFVEKINDQLSTLEVSHLELYLPENNLRLWKGKGLYTGILARFVDGQLIVFELNESSDAKDKGIAKGDLIVSIDGQSKVTPWIAETQGGKYQILRRSSKTEKARSFQVYIEPKEVSLDLSIKIKKISEEKVYIKIPSFIRSYFQKEDWHKLASQLLSFKEIWIDLRGNSGGSLLAALRGVSPFFCNPTPVGFLEKPSVKNDRSAEFRDEVDELKQLDSMNHVSQIILKTFSDYPCVKAKRINILVDYGTSSAAEFFAYVLSKRQGVQVKGQSTAGSVVMASWYKVPFKRKILSLSIPESIYRDENNKELEGVGVIPGEFLFYDYDQAIEGRDSWLNGLE